MQALSQVDSHSRKAVGKLHQLAQMKEKREADEEERTHCAPFCGMGKAKKSKEMHVTEHLKLANLMPDDSNSKHRPLTAEDKRKIHEAALKIAGVISESEG